MWTGYGMCRLLEFIVYIYVLSDSYNECVFVDTYIGADGAEDGGGKHVILNLERIGRDEVGRADSEQQRVVLLRIREREAGADSPLGGVVGGGLGVGVGGAEDG